MDYLPNNLAYSTMYRVYNQNEIENVWKMAELIAEQVRANQCNPKNGIRCTYYNEYAGEEKLFPCVSLPDNDVHAFEPDPKRPWRCGNHKPDELLKSFARLERRLGISDGKSYGKSGD